MKYKYAISIKNYMARSARREHINQALHISRALGTIPTFRKVAEYVRDCEKEASQPETVSLIASSYEWRCPSCDTLNDEIETSESVTCQQCSAVWTVDNVDHAEGN